MLRKCSLFLSLGFFFVSVHAQLPYTYEKWSKCFAPKGVVKVVDWDQDGNADIVFSAGSKLSIYCQREDSYIPLVTDFALSEIADFAIADFDEDGYNDIIVSNYYSLTLLKGTQDHSLRAAKIELGDGKVYYYGTEAVDINRDGKMDLVCLLKEKVEIRFGKGDGTFEKVNLISLPSEVYSITAVDMNNDKMIDIVGHAATKSDNVILYQDEGEIWQVQATDGCRGKVAVVDFNNDNLQDFVAIDYRKHRLKVYIQKSDRTFTQIANISTSYYPGLVFPTHINNDQNIDFIATSYDGKFYHYINMQNQFYASAAAVDIDIHAKDMGMLRNNQFFAVTYSNYGIVSFPKINSSFTNTETIHKPFLVVENVEARQRIQDTLSKKYLLNLNQKIEIISHDKNYIVWIAGHFYLFDMTGEHHKTKNFTAKYSPYGADFKAYERQKNNNSLLDKFLTMYFRDSYYDANWEQNKRSERATLTFEKLTKTLYFNSQSYSDGLEYQAWSDEYIRHQDPFAVISSAAQEKIHKHLLQHFAEEALKNADVFQHNYLVSVTSSSKIEFGRQESRGQNYVVYIQNLRYLYDLDGNFIARK